MNYFHKKRTANPKKGTSTIASVSVCVHCYLYSCCTIFHIYIPCLALDTSDGHLSKWPKLWAPLAVKTSLWKALSFTTQLRNNLHMLAYCCWHFAVFYIFILVVWSKSKIIDCLITNNISETNGTEREKSRVCIKREISVAEANAYSNFSFMIVASSFDGYNNNVNG